MFFCISFLRHTNLHNQNCRNALSVTKMKNILKNRMALSTVVTTLIILVVSVLLAGVVTYFAINVTSTRVQEESLALTKQHVWYNASSTGFTQAAILIINTGGRDVVLDKVSVRGQQVDWNDVFYGTTDASISDDLECNTTLAAGNMTIGSVQVPMTAGSDDLTLRSGYSMVLYITSPDSITINDIGLTVAITVFTSQAMYYKECNVEARTATTAT